MNMLNMLSLESVMTFKTRSRAMNCFMVLVALLAMMQVATAATLPTDPDEGQFSAESKILGVMPSKRKRRMWIGGLVASLVAFLVMIILPHVGLDIFDYDGVSKTMMVTFTVAAGFLSAICMAQWYLSTKINESLTLYNENFDNYEGVIKDVSKKITQSRNISFGFALLAILVSFILFLSMLGPDQIEGERMIGKTMNAMTCLSLFTVGISFMVYVVPYKSENAVDGCNWADKASTPYNWLKNKCSPDDDKELTLFDFFKSKSIVVAILCILAIVLAATNAFGGADEFGNSQMTKVATLVVGSTVLAAICIGAAWRAGRYFSRSIEEKGSYSEWKNNKEKDDLVTRSLQVIVLLVVFLTATVLTGTGSAFHHFEGQGGQALATVWVLFAFTIFGSIRFAMNIMADEEKIASPQKPTMDDLGTNSTYRFKTAGSNDDEEKLDGFGLQKDTMSCNPSKDTSGPNPSQASGEASVKLTLDNKTDCRAKAVGGIKNFPDIDDEPMDMDSEIVADGRNTPENLIDQLSFEVPNQDPVQENRRRMLHDLYF